MPERLAFEYAILRVVPRVERGEFLNAGVVLICRSRRFLGARVGLDCARLRCFAPVLDDRAVAEIEEQLQLIPRIASGDRTSGPIAELDFRERWHWIVAPSSTVLQASPAHTGFCNDPAHTLDTLFDELVSVP